jgi:transposase
MEDFKVIESILNLGEAWIVEKMELEPAEAAVHIYLKYGKAYVVDLTTGELCKIHDYRAERQWQHLPILQCRSYIHCRVPRIKNSNGKVESIKVPWARNTERHTHLFENVVIDTLQATHNQTKTAWLLKTTFDIVNRILHISVARGMNQREIKEGEITQLSIDEKSFGKGHNYISVLTDPLNKRILDVGEGRDTESATKLIKNNLSVNHLKKVKKVSMDMWQPYMNCIKEIIPQADIVHDKFHIVNYLNEGIDNTRRQEVRTEPILLESKYALLKNAENRTENQNEKFHEIMDTNLKTAQAWALSETFKEIFASKTLPEAWAFFDMWIENVNESKIKPMIKVAKTMMNHAIGIINNVKHRISNALAERFNGKIQTLNVIGRGYRTFKNFRSAILFFNARLDLYSHDNL